jgi:hypothetical protein
MKPEVNAVLEQLKHTMNEMDTPSQEQPTQDTPATAKRRINYPAHIKPLEQRVLAALDSGCRTAKTVHTYVGKDVPEKVVNMKLGQLVSRGKIGRKISSSTGYLKYYPYELAKEKGCLQEPKTRKARRTKYELREESYVFDPKKQKVEPFVMPKSLEMAKPQLQPTPIDQDRENYVLFLEGRVRDWQAEARKLQHELDHLTAQANKRQTREIAVENLEKEVQRLQIIVEYYEGKVGK